MEIKNYSDKKAFLNMAAIKAKETTNSIDSLSKGSEVDNILIKVAVEGLLLTFAVDLAKEVYGED